MGIDWGLSSAPQRTKKVEKFDTPVLTMSDLADGGKGKARKFMFNKAAQEALGLVVPSDENDNQSYVTLGKNEVTGEIFVMSSLKEEEGMKFFRVTKSFTFSDKASYEFITNRMGLSNVVENHLHLEAVENEAYFKVASAEPDGEPAASTEEAKEEAPATEEAEEVAETPGTETAEAPKEEAATEEPVAETTEKKEDW